MAFQTPAASRTTSRSHEIAEFRQTIRLDPKLAEPHHGLGVIWLKQHHPEEAIAEFREAIRLNPKNARPHDSLGFIWQSQGHLVDACAEFVIGAKLDPDDPNFPGRIQEIDAQMAGKEHCPPL